MMETDYRGALRTMFSTANPASRRGQRARARRRHRRVLPAGGGAAAHDAPGSRTTALEDARALGDRLWILEDGTNPWFTDRRRPPHGANCCRRHTSSRSSTARSRGPTSPPAYPPPDGAPSVAAGAAGELGTVRRNDERAARRARPLQRSRLGCGLAADRPGDAPLRVSSIAARRSCSASGAPGGIALAAHARPGPERELVLAAEGAAAADRARVAVRLAGGDPLQRRPVRRRQAGALGAQVGPDVADALAQLAGSRDPGRGWTSAAGRVHDARLALPSRLATSRLAVAQLQIPLHQPLVSFVCICRFR